MPDSRVTGLFRKSVVFMIQVFKRKWKSSQRTRRFTLPPSLPLSLLKVYFAPILAGWTKADSNAALESRVPHARLLDTPAAHLTIADLQAPVHTIAALQAPVHTPERKPTCWSAVYQAVINYHQPTGLDLGDVTGYSTKCLKYFCGDAPVEHRINWDRLFLGKQGGQCITKSRTTYPPIKLLG